MAGVYPSPGGVMAGSRVLTAQMRPLLVSAEIVFVFLVTAFKLIASRVISPFPRVIIEEYCIQIIPL